MTASKSPRKKAFAGLKDLTGPRSSKESLVPEVFHFGLDPSIKRGHHDDRAIALITGTAIEQGLESIILTKLIPMDLIEERKIFSDDVAPLNTLDSKIRIAFALGLIGEEARDDLICIKNIRNTFAHSRLDISFETQAVCDAVAELKLPAKMPTYFHDISEKRGVFMETGYRYVSALLMRSPRDEPETTAMWGVILDTFRLASP